MNPYTMKTIAALALILIPAISLMAQQQLKSLVIGNSYTAQVRWGTNGYPGLVDSGGHTGNVREFTYPGVALSQLWFQQEDGYAPLLRNETWTDVSLQAWAGYDNELTNAKRFAEAVWGLGPVGPGADAGDPLGASPDARVFIYMHGRDKVAAFDNGAFFADRTENTGLSDMATFDYFEDMAQQLREDYPEQEVYVIPAAIALYEIDKYMEAGLIPGYSDYVDLTRDGGHTNDDGSYALALCFYATLLGEDPSGLPVPGAYGTDPETSAIFQEIVWRNVSRYPLAGVSDGMVVSTWYLPRGLEGEPYSAQLETFDHAGPVAWSLAEGQLPNGLTLSPDGTLAGEPAENGAFVFSVTASDESGQTDTRQMLLMVDSNNPPVLETDALPDAAIGTPYRAVLDASAGAPPYRWSVKDEVMIHGLTLSPDGVLSGVPIDTPPGDYVVTLVVTDSNPSTPASDEKTFTLTVNEAANGTWVLDPRGDAAITVDGELTEPEWNLAATAEHPLIGLSDNGVAFGIMRTDAGIYAGVSVTDGELVSDSDDAAEDDSVHLFLDARHDRESTFNADDRHLVIGADGRFEERNSRPAGIEHAVRVTPAGYDVEVFIPWSNLELTPATYASIGFDVGNSDDDDGGDRDGYSVWLSATDANTSPAQFGNVCFWPQIGDNLTLNPGLQGGPWQELKFGDRLIDTGDAGQGPLVTAAWLAPFMRRDSNDPLPGWPNQSPIAYGANTGLDGAMLQLFHDEKQTTGKAYLIFDLRDPHPDMNVGVWGYDGSAAEVDGKLAANVREHPINDGSPDAVYLNAYLPSEEPGWVRYVYEVDLGDGSDYLLVGFSLPTLTGESTMRIDNVYFGSAGEGSLTYAAPTNDSASLELLRGTTTEGEAASPLEARVVRANGDSAFGLGVRLEYAGAAAADDFEGGLPGTVVVPARSVDAVLALAPMDDSLVEGDESLTINLVAGNGYSVGSPASAAFTILDAVSRLQQWLIDHFGGTTDVPEDGDGDGAPWQWEYFTGGSPVTPENIRRPFTAGLLEGLSNAMEVSVRYDPMADEFEAFVETSNDLVQWTRHALLGDGLTVLDETVHPDGTVTLSVSVPSPNLGAERQFARVGLE